MRGVVADSVECDSIRMITDCGVGTYVQLSIPDVPLLYLEPEQAWDLAALLMFHAALIDPGLVE